MTDASEWQGRTGASWAAEWRRTDRSFAGRLVADDAAEATDRRRALRESVGVIDEGTTTQEEGGGHERLEDFIHG